MAHPAEARITQAPQLLPRIDATIDSCAFVSGNSNSPFTCASQSTCTIGSYGQVQCCSASVCSPDYLACVPHGGKVFSEYTTNTLSCPLSAPSCVQWKVITIQGFLGNTIYGCGSASTTKTAYKTVVQGATGGTYGPIAVVAAFDESTGSSLASRSAHDPAPTAAATPGATSAQSDPQGLSPSTTLKLALAIPITIAVIGWVLLIVLAKKKDKYKLLRFMTCGLVRKKHRPTSSSPTANGFYRPQQAVARQGDHGNLLGNYNAARDGGDVNFHHGDGSGWRVNQVHFHQASNGNLQHDGRGRRDEEG